MNLACKKNTWSIYKSFGNWEDPPPPIWEKFPNNPVIFFWVGPIVIIVYILWQWFPTGGDPRKQEAKVHLLCPPMNLEGSSSEESVLQWAKSGLFVKVYHSVLLLRGLGNDKGRCGKVLSNFCCWHKWVSAENLFPRRKGFHLFPVCPSKHVDDGNIFRGFLMGFMKEKREMGFCRKLRQWASLSLLMQSQTPHWLLKGPEHF